MLTANPLFRKCATPPALIFLRDTFPHYSLRRVDTAGASDTNLSTVFTLLSPLRGRTGSSGPTPREAVMGRRSGGRHCGGEARSREALALRSNSAALRADIVGGSNNRSEGGARSAAHRAAAQPLPTGVDPQDVAHEGASVGVVGPIEQLTRGSFFDQTPEIHNRNPVGNVAHDTEVVADEEVSEAELGPQVHEQVQDLRLDRDIERGDHFVADQELRIHRKRSGNHDTLALTAAELVRVAMGIGRVEPHSFKLLADIPLGVVTGKAVKARRLLNDVADPHAWIEAGEWILKDHLNRAAVFASPQESESAVS